MPPRDPAAYAREAHQLHRKAMIQHHLRLQAQAAADGLLECLRTAGVVLVVLDITGTRDTSLTLALTLLAAPQLFGLAVFVFAMSFRGYVRRRVDREVR